MTEKPKFHVVSFSGGKDSTALLLRMLEIGMQVDDVIYCDTTAEFPAMYDHIASVEKYIKRPITRLRPKYDFEYYLLDYKSKYRRNKKSEIYHREGLSFPCAMVRWCTKRLKVDPITEYIKNKSQFEIVQYVGLAADEKWRMKNLNYPLIDWGWTEADCLQYCYEKGFDFGGLYKIFSRVSCWCCPLQSLEELRKLRSNFPDLWKQILEWQEKTWRSFRRDFSAQELEIRFQLEEERLKRGLSINGRCKDFREALRKRLKERMK